MYCIIEYLHVTFRFKWNVVNIAIDSSIVYIVELYKHRKFFGFHYISLYMNLFCHRHFRSVPDVCPTQKYFIKKLAFYAASRPPLDRDSQLRRIPPMHQGEELLPHMLRNKR